MGVTALIALITTLVPVAQNIIASIMKARATLKQSAELTPEQETALDDAIAKLVTNPEEWQKQQAL